jgi:NADPH:quinone reductase-like Zn-dependent oxidoreductase
VIATARQANETFARELGASETVDHTRRDLLNAVRMSYPDGIEAIIDVVSERDVLSRLAALVKEGGRLASSVYAADVESLAQRGIKATNVGVHPDARRLEELSRMVDAGELTVRLERTFPLEKAPEALEESRTGHVRGKIVLRVN